MVIENMFNVSLLTQNDSSDENDFVSEEELDELEESKERLMSVIRSNALNDMQYHNFADLISTIRNCGIDKSILHLYNRDGRLSRLTGVELPSLEALNYGETVPSHVSNLVADKLIIAMEGNAFGDFFRAYYDDWLKPFRAGWRWFKSEVNNANKHKAKIEAYCDVLSSAKNKKLEGTVHSIPINGLKRLLQNNVSRYLSKADQIMKEINDGHTSGEDAVEMADQMRDIRDKVRAEFDEIKGACNAKQDIDLSRVSIADLISIGKEAAKRLDAVAKMDQSYPGFWVTGYNTGKIHAIVSGLLPGWTHAAETVAYAASGGAAGVFAAGVSSTLHEISVFFHRGVISTCSVGWQVLTITSDADMKLCRTIESLLHEVSSRV